MMTVTLGSKFRARETNGFDYLRIGLALAVIAWHSITVSFGPQAGDVLIADTLWVPVIRTLMPIFFALSGFLVSSSLERSSGLKLFLLARVLRIFPALIVEVLLSAILLGPLLTNLSMHDYFTGRNFYSYMANMFGWVHYLLPGVFLGNPDSGIVNRSLWTVPSELECYILLSVLYALRLFSGKWALTAVVATYAGFSLFIIDVDALKDSVIVWTRLLPLAFLSGALAWRWRDRLPAGVVWAAASIIATVVLMADVRTSVIACLPAGYAAAALGCVNVPRNNLLASGDYSYGMYLYAYPIQQLVVSIVGPQRPFLTFLLAVLLIPTFAAFSWHAVEKHVLRLKGRLIARPQPLAVPDHEPQRSGAGT